MEPVILRHRDATRQSLLYGVFAIVVVSVVITAFVFPLPGKWWMLALLPIAAFLAYSAVRLRTLQVRLDESGIWEPNPFRLTYVTPWNDVAQVRKATSDGAMRLRFVGVEVVHADGDTHEIVALKTQAGAAYAETAIEEWLGAIREAKRAARG